MTINNTISEILITIGRNVKKYRLLKKLTQQDLAYNCGNMDKATISNIERFACSGLNISTIVKISIVLEIDLKKFFEK